MKMKKMIICLMIGIAGLFIAPVVADSLVEPAPTGVATDLSDPVVTTTEFDPVAVDNISNESIGQVYMAWFANPGIFFLMIILLTGLIGNIVTTSGSMKQYLSWGLGIVMGVIGSVMGWGMFEGITILNAAILGLVSAGFSNVLYSTGAFKSLFGISKP